MNNSSGTTARQPRICGSTASPSNKAVKAFADPFAVDWLDEREPYGEERCNGMCEGVILHATYAERGERIRIISARRAERHEQDN